MSARAWYLVPLFLASLVGGAMLGRAFWPSVPSRLPPVEAEPLYRQVRSVDVMTCAPREVVVVTCEPADVRESR